MPKKKQEVLVFPEYWQRYGDLDSVVEVAARRAWTFGVLQTQRIYLPVVQENEKLKAEIKELRDECRRTKRALDAANVCRVINHFYVDGVCSQCGSIEPPRQ